MSRSIQGGGGAAAHNLWQNRSAWMKPTTQLPAAGKSLAHLGRGAEGVADAVVHPQHGLSVRKTFDPRGISTPEMIARKEQVGRSIGQNPNVAQFYGSQPTPHGGGTMHFSEYVPGAPGPADVAGMRQAKVQAIRGARQAGFHSAQDIHQGNMVRDARTGDYKVIDMLPTRRDEAIHNTGIGSKPISVTPRGSNLFQDNPQFTGRRALHQQLFQGRSVLQAPAPVPQAATQVVRKRPALAAPAGAIPA